MPHRAKLNVLVLGVGGNVSQGILKALSNSDLDCRIVGACVTPYAAGLYMVDAAYVSPYASDPLFVDWLYDICRKEKIDAVLTGVEEVLTVLAGHKDDLRKQTGALCIVSTPAQLLIGRDKLLTCQWLQQKAFNYPEFADAADASAVDRLVDLVGYPLVVKPRKGKSSEEIVIVQSAEDLKRIKFRQGYVVEQYLGTEEDEYTVGCFCDKAGAVRGTIVMRRRLCCGTTAWAEINNNALVREEAQRIVAALKPMGPCNVQLRVSNGKATSFEINVRFSGTTPLRAHYGFNDVEIALRHYVLGEPVKDLPVLTSGVAMRYWNEIYVDPQAFHEAVKKGHFDPTAYHTSIENYGER